MDQEQTTTAARAIEAEPVRDMAPIDLELASQYQEIATLSELVMELDRRTQPAQSPDRRDYASPEEDRPAPSDLSPIARAVREQHDQVAQINNQLRSIVAGLQT